MSSQSYEIDFDGYWREPNKKGVSSKSGIYCVYACTHNSKENTVNIRKLIYIGESDNVGARIADHEKQSDWESHLKSGEQLCYSFGPVNGTSRDRCEAALINHRKTSNTSIHFLLIEQQ